MLKICELACTTILLFCCINAYSQPPEVVIQKEYGSIENIKFSPNGEQFITYALGATDLDINLWDAHSKLMLGYVNIYFGNGEGSGKIKLMNDGIVYVNDNQHIYRYDLIANSNETIYETVFPNYIHDFEWLDNHQLFVLEKIYSEQQKEVQEESHHFNAVIYDAQSKKIEIERQINQELTAVAIPPAHNFLLLLSSNGKALFLDSSLQEYRSPITINQTKAPGFYCFDKSGKHLIYNEQLHTEIKLLDVESGNIVQRIQLPKPHDAPETNFFASSVDELYNMIYIASENVLYTHSGYNTISRIDLATFETTDHSIIDFDDQIGSLAYNPLSDEGFITHGKTGSMFRAKSNLSIVDFEHKEILARIQQNFTANTNCFSNLITVGGQRFLTATDPESGSKTYHNNLTLHSLDLLTTSRITCGSNCLISQNRSTDHVLIEMGTGNRSFPQKLADIDIYAGILGTNWLGRTVDLSQPESDPTNIFEDFTKINLTEISSWKKIKKYSSYEILHYLDKQKRLIVAFSNADETTVAILDEHGNLLKEIPAEYSVNAKTSPDDAYLALYWSEGSKHELIVIDTQKLTTVYKKTVKADDLITIGFSFGDLPDDFFYSYNTFDHQTGFLGQVFRIDLRSSKPAETPFYKGDLFFADFEVSNKNSLILGNSLESYIIYDTKAGHIEESVYTGTGSIDHFTYYPGENTLLVSGNKLYSRLINLSKKTAVTYHQSNEHFFAQNADGYYMAFDYIPNNIAFVVNNKSYPFTQFDLKYNRPDKVMLDLDMLTAERQQLFQEAYNKRISNLQIDTSLINLPISNLPSVKLTYSRKSFHTTDQAIPVNVSMHDSLSTLKAWNIWVNGVPLFGKNGKLIEGTVQNYSTHYPIPLSSGTNNIQISCTNARGLESMRESFSIHRVSDDTKTKVYYIGVGVSDYLDTTMNLVYPTKDVMDLDKLFKEKYQNYEAHLLLDNKVTLENLQKIHDILAQTTVDDQVIISFHGHGLVDDESNFYFATYDMDFDHPQKRGFSYDQLYQLFSFGSSRKNVIFLDACHSGEIDSDGQTNTVSTENTQVKATETPFNNRGSKAIAVSKKDNLQNSFALKQRLFNNFIGSDGTVIISASAGVEYAYESDEWKNGVFTYSIINGLKNNRADSDANGQITISELKAHVSRQVKELTDGQQTPNARQENVSTDFQIW